MRRARALGMALVLAGSACGGAPLQVAALDDLERVRNAPGRTDDAALAPEAFARAEQERGYALQAHAASDDVGATLHAERSMAAYARARAVARYARAAAERDSAQKALDDASAQETALEASRASLQREADELDERVRLARDRLLPASSSVANPERDAARGVAARSLGMQARLLCSAARLVTPEAKGLADAETEAAAVVGNAAPGAKDATDGSGGRAKTGDERGGARPQAIDAAAHARTRCLEVLTSARRAAGHDAGETDALLAELSAAGGWDPSADERGVVVTLHDVFHGTELAETGATKLAELGRVAAAHPLFGVQVVVHDARAPAPGDTGDAKRADAAVRALVAGGADAAHVRSELAGALAPIVDPNAATLRARNERIEVVFVAR